MSGGTANKVYMALCFDVMKSPEDAHFSGTRGAAVAESCSGKYKIFMSSCIALKISLWWYAGQFCVLKARVGVLFFFQNVIKIILTIFVGRGKINSYFVVSYPALKQQSGFHLNQ